jgi:hypothetical protein
MQHLIWNSGIALYSINVGFWRVKKIFPCEIDMKYEKLLTFELVNLECQEKNHSRKEFGEMKNILPKHLTHKMEKYNNYQINAYDKTAEIDFIS